METEILCLHASNSGTCPGLWIVPRLSKNYVYENPQKKESVSNERSFKELLRADVCKYRPEVGKIKFLRNPKKIM